MGGLGNQLFQYATGRAIAQHKQVSLKLDLSWFDIQELRSYRLEHFNISAEIANPSEIAAIKGSHLKGFQ